MEQSHLAGSVGAAGPNRPAARDFEALEKRRFGAIGLLEGGLKQTEIARRLRVSRSTVVRWVSQYRQQGKQELRKAGRVGRRPRLSAADRQRLETLLVRSL